MELEEQIRLAVRVAMNKYGYKVNYKDEEPSFESIEDSAVVEIMKLIDPKQKTSYETEEEATRIIDEQIEDEEIRYRDGEDGF